MRAVAALCVATLCATALALYGCGEKQEPSAFDERSPATTATDAAASRPGLDESPAETPGDAPWDEPHGEAPAPLELPPAAERIKALERSAVRTVRRYIAALDAKNGGQLCGLFAPGALNEVELPRKRGDCASSLAASIGYRDPRGLPVWEAAELRNARVSELADDGRSATVIATVGTRFADRRQVSIEDDVIYLVRRDRSWAIAKPSATLYRAVGIADIPPSVLAPPSG